MLTGWKTVIGMAVVLVGQACKLMAAKWPYLDPLGDLLINIGSGIGVVGVSARVIRTAQASKE